MSSTSGIPGVGEVVAAVRIGLQAVDQSGDLVDDPPVRRGPGPPLLAIDGAQFALGVRPFVPDADAVVLQPADVGLAAQEPQQFHDDRAQMQLLGGQEGKAPRQVEPHLAAEHAQRPRARAVAPLGAVLQNVGQEAKILELGMVGRRGRLRAGAGLKVGDGGEGVHADRLPPGDRFAKLGVIWPDPCPQL